MDSLSIGYRSPIGCAWFISLQREQTDPILVYRDFGEFIVIVWEFYPGT
jgi:hypothetical protein